MQRNTDHRLASRLVSAAAIASGTCCLVAGTAAAVELGDVQVESTLGQPLRASIPFALNPNEQMFDFCVRVRPNPGDGLIPTITRAKVSVTGNRIFIVGETVVRDPLLNLQVAIDCPYTPRIERQYTLVVDPVEFAENNRRVVAQTAAAVSQPAAAAPANPTPPAEVARAPDSVPAAVAPVETSPVTMGSDYRVSSGDSVSVIAARIDARPIGLREAITAIVASNPDAFVDGDPSRLLAGSLLQIPVMSADTPAMSAPIAAVAERPREYAPVAEPIAEPPVAPITPVREPVADVADLASGPATVDSAPEDSAVVDTLTRSPADATDPAVAAPIGEPQTSTAAPETVAESDVVATTPEAEFDGVEPALIDGSDTAASASAGSADALQPGDVVMPGMTITADSAEVAPANVPAVVATDTSDSGNAWSWLSWPIGIALVLGIGILLLAGRIRDAFRSIAIGGPDKPKAAEQSLQAIPEGADAIPESSADVLEPLVAEVAEPLVAEIPESGSADEAVDLAQPAVDSVDYEFSDAVAGDAMSLDADFDAGTGLQDSGDLDVAEDFGFAASSGMVESDIDHEIPEEAAAEEQATPTDVIPPSHREDVSSILDAEIAPDADDYDMSMIVDATKQSMNDTHMTAQDLHAVPVDQGHTDEYRISDDTLASEADLAALEQDYQEEFTQTQALNKEIEQAAAELAAKLDNDIDDDDPTGDEPVLTIEDPGLEPTAQMPRRTPDNDVTAEMPARAPEGSETAEMPAELTAADLTAEMPTQISDLDDTEEVPLEEATAEVTVDIAAGVGAENDDVVEDAEVTSKLAAGGVEPTVEMPVDVSSTDDATDK